MANMFKTFDKDGNNTISYDEARSVLKDFDFSDEEIRSIMTIHDSNKDGVLQYDEFVHFWGECSEKTNKAS